MDVGTRRIVLCNVTLRPTEWTVQQFREAIPSDHSYRFLVRGRGSIFSTDVDEQLNAFGLRSCARRRGRPKRMPNANAWWERFAANVWIS